MTWVRRPKGKWHLAESLVAGDAITYCGRRLRNELGTLEESEVKPHNIDIRIVGQPQNCRVCDPVSE